jgi:hypothetical protein
MLALLGVRFLFLSQVLPALGGKNQSAKDIVGELCPDTAASERDKLKQAFEDPGQDPDRWQAKPYTKGEPPYLTFLGIVIPSPSADPEPSPSVCYHSSMVVNLARCLCGMYTGNRLLLGGDCATGKSACIQEMARLLGFELVSVNCSAATSEQDVLGSFAPIPGKGMRAFEWQDSTLVKAFSIPETVASGVRPPSAQASRKKHHSDRASPPVTRVFSPVVVALENIDNLTGAMLQQVSPFLDSGREVLCLEGNPQVVNLSNTFVIATCTAEPGSVVGGALGRSLAWSNVDLSREELAATILKHLESCQAGGSRTSDFLAALHSELPGLLQAAGGEALPLNLRHAVKFCRVFQGLQRGCAAEGQDKAQVYIWISFPRVRSGEESLPCLSSLPSPSSTFLCALGVYVCVCVCVSGAAPLF